MAVPSPSHPPYPDAVRRSLAPLLLGVVVAVAGLTAGRVSGAAGTPGASLVGRWAHYDAVAYQDTTLKTLIISYGFNDFSERRGRVVDHPSFCFAEQRTNQPITTTISDAATQAIRPPSTPVRVDRVDGRLRVRRPPTPTPVGIRLADPANDALPTDPAGADLVDADGDGKPGITVDISVGTGLRGQIYLARREIFAWEATLTRPDRLDGTVTDTSEQLLIGATDPVFAGAAADWVQVADPAKSPIVLVRVGRNWDCARLAAERDRLFPPPPVVDW